MIIATSTTIFIMTTTTTSTHMLGASRSCFQTAMSRSNVPSVSLRVNCPHRPPRISIHATEPEREGFTSDGLCRWTQQMLAQDLRVRERERGRERDVERERQGERDERDERDERG